jgi:hypothetical protein
VRIHLCIAVGSLVVSGVGSGEVLAAPRAPQCLQAQYHSGFKAESAFYVASEAKDSAAVSRARGVAVSPGRGSWNYFSIPIQKCRLNVSPIAKSKQGNDAAHSSPKVSFNSKLKARPVQYQARHVRYQPSRPAAIEAVVTKPTQADTRLMIRIGLLLGIAYLVFLTIWFWATRLRPRPRRAGSGIDTGR